MVPPVCFLSLTNTSWLNPTAGESFHDDYSSLLLAFYLLLTRTSWFNATASESFHGGSPGPACYLSLTRTWWFDPTASEFLYDDPPSLSHVANQNSVAVRSDRV
jgi:hypothetical protein